MTADVTVLVILGLAIVVFLLNRTSPGVVALCAACALYLTGVMPFEAVIAGFADPVVIFIASLFVVSAGLEASGVSAWLSSTLIDRLGTGRRKVMLGLMTVGALLTALITVNGAVAALVPVAVALAVKTNRSPSKLLIPLAFAAHAGSLLTLMGSPVNLLVSEISEEAGGPTFRFFEFAAAGIPLLIGTFVLVLWLSPALLPDRNPAGVPTDEGGSGDGVRESADGGAEVRTKVARPRLGVPAVSALVIVALMVVGLVAGVAPPAFVALCAALAMMILRVVTPSQAHRSLPITTLVTIAGMIPLSVAIQTSGAGDLIAGVLTSFLGDAHPRVMLLGLVLVVLALGQFTSNVATVLIVAPIALSVAEAGGYSVAPFMMGLCVAGAAALFTPIATPANLMIMAPGGYRFSDYWRMGLPLSALYVLVAVLWVPVVWPF